MDATSRITIVCPCLNNVLNGAVWYGFISKELLDTVTPCSVCLGTFPNKLGGFPGTGIFIPKNIYYLFFAQM